MYGAKNYNKAFCVILPLLIKFQTYTRMVLIQGHVILMCIRQYLKEFTPYLFSTAVLVTSSHSLFFLLASRLSMI